MTIHMDHRLSTMICICDTFVYDTTTFTQRMWGIVRRVDAWSRSCFERGEWDSFDLWDSRIGVVDRRAEVEGYSTDEDCGEAGI